MLEELTQYHSDILSQARQRLDALDGHSRYGNVAITHRAKTTQTIIEKLQRQPDLQLASIQDLAGIRVVGAITLQQQDDLASEVGTLFPPDPREPRVVDRRAKPSWGYRAVHVIASLEGANVEVQLRTIRQDLWANISERSADQIGRGIRYGKIPPDWNPELIGILTDGFQRLSDRFYDRELAPDCPVDPRQDPATLAALDELDVAIARARAHAAELLRQASGS